MSGLSKDLARRRAVLAAAMLLENAMRDGQWWIRNAGMSDDVSAEFLHEEQLLQCEAIRALVTDLERRAGISSLECVRDHRRRLRTKLVPP